MIQGSLPVWVLALTMRSSKPSKRSRDSEHSTKKKHKSSESRKKRKYSTHDSVHITDDDPNDDDMWVEKNIDIDGEGVRMPVSSCDTC